MNIYIYIYICVCFLYVYVFVHLLSLCNDIKLKSLVRLLCLSRYLIRFVSQPQQQQQQQQQHLYPPTNTYAFHFPLQ
jgi:hypothetical protein